MGENARAGHRWTRRDVLRSAGLASLGIGLGEAAGRAEPAHAGDRAVILILLTGGPSQLDTFDPKPDAPSDVRGPFRAIATAVPGVRVAEHLPRLASRMDRVAIVRGLSHDAAPIHEAGFQLLQTGTLFPSGAETHPHAGAVAARVLATKAGAPAFALLPGPIGHTGVGIPSGQSAGPLGPGFGPVSPPDATFAALERDRDLRRYGGTSFGRDCLRARHLVERGSRFVVVNMYQTVFGGLSWDCHGVAPFSTLDDYARDVLPAFDRAFSALLDDLDRSGRLASTLVVAAGEFGRTPRLNGAGGRDHWPGCASALLAGGGIRGGSVLGSSDRTASEPADRPVAPAELVATMYHALGIDPAGHVAASDGRTIPLVPGAGPIRELLS